MADGGEAGATIVVEVSKKCGGKKGRGIKKAPKGQRATEEMKMGRVKCGY